MPVMVLFALIYIARFYRKKQPPGLEILISTPAYIYIHLHTNVVDRPFIKALVKLMAVKYNMSLISRSSTPELSSSVALAPLFKGVWTSEELIVHPIHEV